ncbi:ricin-type beta-trefoil lectin domain protein [Lentzea sp. JNUCC 0626]|uniref:ricin-type beta-trefoil lectin domain protein n=1 Tax=Lentzea sp. JNUCC 0626 TaxID=3367513 RepID=UPI003748A2DF
MLRKSGYAFAVFALLFTVLTPAASAAEPPRLGGVGADAVWSVLYNRAHPDFCLANQHPRVFNFGGCTGQYNDQYWTVNAYSQIVNYHHGGCLTAHAAGNVFTFDCGPRFRDSLWRNYQGIPGMLENVEHPGRCLAGHTNGNVFLFTCTPGFTDQYWGAY